MYDLSLICEVNVVVAQVRLFGVYILSIKYLFNYTSFSF